MNMNMNMGLVKGAKYNYTSEDVEPFIGKKILCCKDYTSHHLGETGKYYKGEYYLLESYNSEYVIPYARFANMECCIYDTAFYQHFDLEDEDEDDTEGC